MSDSLKISSRVTPSTNLSKFFLDGAHPVAYSEFELLVKRVEKIEDPRRFFTDSSSTDVQRVDPRYVFPFGRASSQLEVPQKAFTSTDYSTSLSNLMRALEESKNSGAVATSAQNDSTPVGIALPSLLKFISILMLVSAGASLTLWIGGYPALLNPFISLLVLVASPFVFAMSRAAYRPESD